MSRNNETVAMLVYQENPVGVELFSYAGHVSENALFFETVGAQNKDHGGASQADVTKWG